MEDYQLTSDLMLDFKICLTLVPILSTPIYAELYKMAGIMYRC